MAMYIVLRVEDDGEALSLIDTLHEDVAKPVGLYKVPTLFCECEYNPNGIRNRSKTYGWFLCKECDKPTKWTSQMPVNLLQLEVEAQNDPDFQDHVLHIHHDQHVGRERRKKSQAIFWKSVTE